jgi:hypothetical protein
MRRELSEGARKNVDQAQKIFRGLTSAKEFTVELIMERMKVGRTHATLIHEVVVEENEGIFFPEKVLTKDDLRQFLKENLRIELNVHRGSFGSSENLEVKLSLAKGDNPCSIYDYEHITEASISLSELREQ